MTQNVIFWFMHVTSCTEWCQISNITIFCPQMKWHIEHHTPSQNCQMYYVFRHIFCQTPSHFKCHIMGQNATFCFSCVTYILNVTSKIKNVTCFSCVTGFTLRMSHDKRHMTNVTYVTSCLKHVKFLFSCVTSFSKLSHLDWHIQVHKTSHNAFYAS